MSKYPELEKMRDRLEARQAKILDEISDDRAALDALRAEECALRDKMAPHKAVILKARPQLAAIAMELSGVARATGGKRLSEGGTEAPTAKE